MAKTKLTAVEKPVEFWINDKLINIFLCSPYDLKDFALGYLFTSGIINAKEDIDILSINADYDKICIYLKDETSKQILNKAKYIISQYNYRNRFYQCIQSIPKLNSNHKFPLDYIQRQAKLMIEKSIINQETGGVHSALISNLNKDFFIREDISKHTAIDKALGAYLEAFSCLEDSFVCTSGRLSVDMVLKAAILNIPVIASLYRPSSLALELANYYNITLIAEILCKEPIIYSLDSRISF